MAIAKLRPQYKTATNAPDIDQNTDGLMSVLIALSVAVCMFFDGPCSTRTSISATHTQNSTTAVL
jgi:hypothetical protein